MRQLSKGWKLSIIVALHVLALAARYALLGHASVDMQTYLVPWYNYIVDHGGYRALGQAFSNYSPAYIYLLVLATYLRPLLPDVFAIKAMSIPFDFLAAFFMYRLVRLKFAAGPLPWLAYFAVLFAPTVVLNSACWGQCDAIYAAFLLGCIYLTCARRPAAAMLSLGAALAFKAQAVFLAPLVLILLLKRQLPWRHTLLVPLVYLLSLVPSALLGAPLLDLLTAYLIQTRMYSSLSRSAPNLYVLIPDTYYSIGVIAGTAVAVAAALGMVFAQVKSKARLTHELLILTAILSVLLLPFLLPKMHDRYFFPADLISIGAAFFYARLRRVPFLLQISSLIAYEPMLTLKQTIPLPVASAVNAVVVASLVVVYVRALFPRQECARGWAGEASG